MRIIKRKCVGGPIDGQEIIVADHIEHFQAQSMSNKPKVVDATREQLNHPKFVFYNYELKNEEFIYVGKE